MLKIEAQACSRLDPSREIVFQGGLFYVQEAKLMMIRQERRNPPVWNLVNLA